MSATSTNVQITIAARDLASAVMGNVSRSAQGLGQTFGSVGQIATGVFAGNLVTNAIGAIGGALRGTVTQAADFEHAMSAVAAVAGANSTQLAQLSATALQLGQDTTLAGVNATDAAAAMQELAAGGVSVTDIIGGAARGALLLASAGGIDFASAADIAANSMNAFGLAGQDVTHIADLFAAAANASSANVQDIGVSMQYIGPIAHSLGLSIDETTAALAELGSQGIKGEQAGTTLRAMLTALAAPAKPAQKVITDLGLSFFDAGGHMKSLAGIADELHTKLAGLTDQQRAAALSTLFSNAALSGATVLTSEGAAGIQNYLGQVNQAGSAAANGAIRNDNLAGSFEQLKSTVQTAAITFGTQFLPLLRTVVDTAAGAVNAAIPRIQSFASAVAGVLTSVARALGGLAGPILAIIGAIGGALAVLAALGGALAGGSIVIGLIGTALSTVGSVLAPLVPAILALTAGIGILAIAWRANIGGLRDFTDHLLTLGRSVPEMVTALVRGFASGDFNQAFGPIIEAIDHAFGPEAAGKLTLFVSNGLKVAQVLRDSFLTFRAALAGDWFGGQTEGINVWVRTIGRATQLGRDAFLTFRAALAGDWAGGATASINGFVRIVGNLGLVLRDWLGTLRLIPGLVIDAFSLLTGGTVAGGLDGFRARFATFWSGILNILGTYYGLLTAGLLNLGTFLINWLTPVIPRVLTAFGQLFANLVNLITGTAGGEVQGAMASTMPNAFMAWVGPALGPFLTAIGRFVTTMITFIGASAPAVIAQLGVWARAFGDWVTDTAIPYLAPKLTAIADALGGWISGTALPFVTGRLVGLATAFGDWVTTTAVPYLQAKLPEWISALGNWFATDVGPTLQRVFAAIGQFFGDWIVLYAIPELARWIPVLQAVFEGLGALLTTIVVNLGHNIGVGLIRGILDAFIGGLGAIQAAIPDWLKPFIPGFTTVDTGKLTGLVNQQLTSVPLASQQDTQAFQAQIAAAIAKAQAAPETTGQPVFQVNITGNNGIGIDDLTTLIAEALKPKLVGAAGGTNTRK